MILNNFELLTQKRNNTCGYATASMIISFLEEGEIDEDYLFENEPFDERGITFSKLIEVYTKYLIKFKAEIAQEDIEDTHQLIIESLIAELPIHILHLTPNKLGQNEPVLHYSAVIGYDDLQNKYIVADPYGSIKEIGKIEFFESISFRNECLSEQIKKNVPSNTLIRFCVK